MAPCLEPVNEKHLFEQDEEMFYCGRGNEDFLRKAEDEKRRGSRVHRVRDSRFCRIHLVINPSSWLLYPLS